MAVITAFADRWCRLCALAFPALPQPIAKLGLGLRLRLTRSLWQTQNCPIFSERSFDAPNFDNLCLHSVLDMDAIGGLPSNYPPELQRMDGRMHDRRPYKRTRLEYTFESQTVSCSSSRDAVNVGRDHGVYYEAPPRLSPEELEAGNISPSITPCEAHHRLNVDYHLPQCIGFDCQSIRTSGSKISSLPSTLSATGGNSSGYSNGFSNRDTTEQVCFGMVRLPSLEHSPQYTIGRM